MALIGTLAINMKVLTADLAKGMRSASKSINSFGAGAAVAARQAMIGLTAIGGAGVAAMYKATRAASGLAEQTDMLRETFGKDVGEKIADQAKVMGEAFGTSRVSFMSSVGRIGSQFQGMGYAADDAAKLGVQFTKLAMDMASVKQISNEEAFTRMASGLSGESEAVRRWGADLDVANLQLEAVRLGITKTSRELTQAEKIQVRSILMDQKFAYAKGNLAKTMAGAENATKGLMGRLENLAAQIGTALLPIVASAMVQLQTGVQVLSMLWSDWTKGVVNESVGVIGSVGVQSESVGFLQKSVIFVADAWQTVKGVFLTVQSYITAGIGKLIEVVAYLANSFDVVAQKLGRTRTGIGDVLQTYSEDLARLSETQFASAGAALTAPSAAAGVGDFFKRAQDRIAAMRTEAKTTSVNPADFKPAGLATPTKAGELKFASASAVGSSEATNAILKSRFGGGAGGKQPEQQTAKNTAEMVALMRRMVGGSRNPIEIKGITRSQQVGLGALAGLF